jgi:hypothetical protein
MTFARFRLEDWAAFKAAWRDWVDLKGITPETPPDDIFREWEAFKKQWKGVVVQYRVVWRERGPNGGLIMRDELYNTPRTAADLITVLRVDKHAAEAPRLFVLRTLEEEVDPEEFVAKIRAAGE